MTFSRAMVLFAHPDDAEFFCGGTVARWAREGCEVHYVCATDGSAGSNDPGTTREAMRVVREREMRAAADILGVSSVTFLGEVDGFLAVTPDTRRKVTREVRRLRPDVLVAPDPSRLWSGNGYINHADHKAAGELALCAVMPDAPTRVMFQELEDEGLEPFEVPNLYLVGGGGGYVRRHHGHARGQAQGARPHTRRSWVPTSRSGSRRAPGRWGSERDASSRRGSGRSGSSTTDD